jgi:hypothetical protein
LCRVWYSCKTYALGWKAHLRSKLGISGSGTASSGHGTVLVQSALGKVLFPDCVLRKFENTIVDYVVGGGISMRAAGGQRLKQPVVSLTNGYEPLSTRTILRRIVELFRIAEPLLSSFFRLLDVAISLTLDGWSNRNLKGFYVVRVHWVDVSSMAKRGLLLTIIDVPCGTGVGRRVGTALFNTAWAGTCSPACRTWSAIIAGMPRPLSSSYSSFSTARSATSRCSRPTTSGAPTTRCSSVSPKSLRSSSRPTSSCGKQWSASAAVWSCDRSIV